MNNSTIAQDWKELVISNEVVMSFPQLPLKKTLAENEEVYLYKCLDYAMMVGVNKGDYSDEIAKKDSLENLNQLNRLFDESISTKLSKSHGHLEDLKSISLEGGYACEFKIRVNDSGFEKERFTVLILLKNAFYLIEYWCLNAKNITIDKDIFFKSIVIRVSSE